MDAQLPLFVFGTLRRGRRNHRRYLAGRYVRQLPAVLPGFARVEPLMIARRDGETVDGELYFLRPDDYEDTLRRCDDLEGIPRGSLVGPDYRRGVVTVQTRDGACRAWAYVHPDTPPFAEEETTTDVREG